MNNKYINGMNEIKADDEFKRKIISNIKQSNSKKISRFFTSQKVITAVAVACTFAIIILFGVPFIQNGSDTLRKGQSEMQSLFDGFAITAYAADGTSIEVRPNVQFPLGKYQMTMSSVPGFPITIACEKADVIKLTATDGEFLLWIPPDWQVYNKGKELAIKSGDTVYWSPSKEGNTSAIATNCNLVIKGYKNNIELGSNSIKIELDGNYTYTGRLLE